jgi:hypothetical protein
MGLGYQLLCAKELKLTHPVTGEELKILSNLNI